MLNYTKEDFILILKLIVERNPSVDNILCFINMILDCDDSDEAWMDILLDLFHTLTYNLGFNILTELQQNIILKVRNNFFMKKIEAVLNQLKISLSNSLIANLELTDFEKVYINELVGNYNLSIGNLDYNFILSHSVIGQVISDLIFDYQNIVLKKSFKAKKV